MVVTATPAFLKPVTITASFSCLEIKSHWSGLSWESLRRGQIP